MTDDLATAATGSAVPQAASPAPAPTHFPGLEGLRAIAATLVVLTHAATLSGAHRSGWVGRPAAVADIGVAIFFVLSGFLIYRPFVRAHLAGKPPLRARSFWWRRLLRIFPAYWLALSCFWALGWFHLGHDWWRYYLLLQIYNPFTTFSGVVQAWSIATEVTFYLMIPFWSGLLRLVSRRRTSFALELAGAALLFAAGYASRVLFSASHRYWVKPGAFGPGPGTQMRQVAFSWLPNQIDLFAVGMAVAIVYSWAERTDRLDQLGRVLGRGADLWWLAALGTFLVVTYVLGPPGDIGYIGLHWQARQALYGLVGLLLLVPLVFGDQSTGLVRRFVQLRPIAWVGTVSYGFYLFHLNLMSKATDHLPRIDSLGHHLGLPAGWAGTGAYDGNVLVILISGIVLGLLAAAVSWYVLEKPLLRLKRLF